MIDSIKLVVFVALAGCAGKLDGPPPDSSIEDGGSTKGSGADAVAKDDAPTLVMAMCPSFFDHAHEGCPSAGAHCPDGTICVGKGVSGGTSYIGCAPIPSTCASTPTCACLACLCGEHACTDFTHHANGTTTGVQCD